MPNSTRASDRPVSRFDPACSRTPPGYGLVRLAWCPRTERSQRDDRSTDASGDGGARPDGLQPRSPPDARRPPLRGVRPGSRRRVETLRLEGATGVDSLAELVAALPAPRNVWLMLPAGEITERAIAELAGLVEPGDTIIDGGNAHYVDDLARGAQLAATRHPLRRRRGLGRRLRAGAWVLPHGGRRGRGVRAPGTAVRVARARASTTAARTRGRDGRRRRPRRWATCTADRSAPVTS